MGVPLIPFDVARCHNRGLSLLCDASSTALESAQSLSLSVGLEDPKRLSYFHSRRVAGKAIAHRTLTSSCHIVLLCGCRTLCVMR